MRESINGKKDFAALTHDEISALFAGMGQPAFRAQQATAWLMRGASSFDDMTNLPVSLRSKLQESFYIPALTAERVYESAEDGTVKYLFRLHDGHHIESVLMRYRYGCSLCVSTQVGCRMGCAFCATGQGGLTRNLTAFEMLAQIHEAGRVSGVRISHVVLMGMGEPLDNYSETLAFLRQVGSPDGLNIGMRHISLSTCGLVDQIYRLREENLQLTLSVSLHAPNDQIRKQLMPIAKKWSIEALTRACRDYAAATKRRISFEYIMIAGLNDTDACAGELCRLLKGILCHVNLIPVNPVAESAFRPSGGARITAFQSLLMAGGVNATIRRTLGPDIAASCGQLRGLHAEKEGG